MRTMRTLSKGPADKPIKVPNLEGMTQSLAESTINTYNLKTGRIDDTQYSDTVEAGKVISQYPIAETEVPEGTEVNLIISAGPDPSTLTTDPPENQNPIPVTKSFTVPLDGYEGDVNVRVLMDGAQVWNRNYDATMETAAEIQIQGSRGMGTKEVTIFINGVAKGTESVNFDA